MADEFDRGRDLNKADQFAAECRDYATGMRQQADASRQSSAMSGHPYPEHMYNRVAELLELAARRAESGTVLPAETTAPESPPEGDKTKQKR